MKIIFTNARSFDYSILNIGKYAFSTRIDKILLDGIWTLFYDLSAQILK